MSSNLSMVSKTDTSGIKSAINWLEHTPLKHVTKPVSMRRHKSAKVLVSKEMMEAASFLITLERQNRFSCPMITTNPQYRSYLQKIEKSVLISLSIAQVRLKLINANFS